MVNPEISIREGSLDEALEVLSKLPEFDKLKARDYYQSQLADDSAYILIAHIQDEPIACKLGYDRFQGGSFYSWLGGVLPAYRKLGIAKALARQQETFATSKGYASIRLKTQNRHKAMLLFAIKNGFELDNIKPKAELEFYRIELIKTLKI